MRPILILICSLLSIAAPALGQDTPFHKGINLTNWFQAKGPRQIQFTKYTRTDFVQIKSLGCDVIRLPINLHAMTNGAPQYQLDPLFLSMLDSAVTWAEELSLHLILDNHTFDPAKDTDPQIGAILEKVWKQMASHYLNRSELIYYEILNEPHGIADATWNGIQGNIINAIRTIDTKHTIIVGPASWNSYNNLALMPTYADTNLIYTFHFYDPFLFTHQGAGWNTPSMEPLADIPFPYKADKMPLLPVSLKGTWVESSYNNYFRDGTEAKVKSLIDIAVQFRQSRKVPIFCGEFGVYIPNSDPADRVYWYDVVRKYMEEKGISWTAWDYHGGFGLFTEDGNDLFDHDLNVPLLKALGFNVPTQTGYIQRPDSTGFPIYGDYLEQNVIEASYNDGTLDYYYPNQPYKGQYCIYWTGAVQYNAIVFDFKPNKDLSWLASNNYFLEFYVKGNTPGASFDVRFLDTKTSEPGDRPWRNRVTINERYTVWDNQWRLIRLPLRSFQEQGAWDNGWFNPQGKFDWKAIDRLEIVAEQQALGKAELWFDQIRVVGENAVSTTPELAEAWQVNIYPNPSNGLVRVETSHPQPLTCTLTDIWGRKLQAAPLLQSAELDLSQYSKGMYSLWVGDDSGRIVVRKLMLQ